jgi:UDPglucose 6-dehydrogenase
VIEVNEAQRARMVTKILAALGLDESAMLQGVTLGVLGLAFKPDTDDVRESPALAIAEELARRGARIQAYDPAAMEQARALLPDIVYRPDAYSAAEDADAVVLMTEWNQFRNLDLSRMKSLMRRPILVDLRNVYEPERMKALGLAYQGVGRGVPDTSAKDTSREVMTDRRARERA